MEKRLERHLDEAQLGGVAAGLAHYFDIDRTLVRVLFVAGVFIPSAPALILYIVLWVVLPERRFGTLPPASTIYSTPAFLMSANQKQNGNLVGGAILIIIGLFALLDRYIDIDFRDVWPLLLIGFGAWLILRDRKPDLPANRYPDSDTPPTPPSTDPYDPNRPINQL